MCDIFWKGSFQHEKWPWDYDKWGVLTCTFPSYNRLCWSWDSRLSASCDGAPCKTHLFPNWPSEGMINCLEVASCQLACDLCSLCSNHLLRTYEAASPFLSPFRTYYCWERTGPGLQGSHAKIGTLAPSSLTVKEIYRLILSSLLQFWGLFQLWAGLQESNKTENALTCLGIVIAEPLLVRLRKF